MDRFTIEADSNLTMTQQIDLHIPLEAIDSRVDKVQVLITFAGRKPRVVTFHNPNF